MEEKTTVISYGQDVLHIRELYQHLKQKNLFRYLRNIGSLYSCSVQSPLTPDQPTLDVHFLCIFIQKIFSLLSLIDYTAIINFLVV